MTMGGQHRIVETGNGPLIQHAGCPMCGFAYRTSTTRCEKMCPNCGHRESCHD